MTKKLRFLLIGFLVVFTVLLVIFTNTPQVVQVEPSSTPTVFVSKTPATITETRMVITKTMVITPTPTQTARIISTPTFTKLPDLPPWDIVLITVVQTCNTAIEDIVELANRDNTLWEEWEEPVTMLHGCGEALQRLPEAPEGYEDTVVKLKQAGNEYVLAARAYETAIKDRRQSSIETAASHLAFAAYYMNEAQEAIP